MDGGWANYVLIDKGGETVELRFIGPDQSGMTTVRLLEADRVVINADAHSASAGLPLS